MAGVDPDDIEAIVAQVSAIYQEGERALLREIADHLRRYPGAPTAFAQPRADALAALRRAATAVQTALAADGAGAIRDAVARSWQLGSRAAVADLPAKWFPKSGIGQAADAARPLVPQGGAIEALATALIRDVGRVSANILRDTLDAYRSAIAGGTARMLAGGQSRRDATQAAWQALVARGVFGFTDKSGRRWRLHSYAEMATRTASARAAVTGQSDRLDSLGLDLVVISDHGQECGLCRRWEGKILHRSGGRAGRIRVEHGIRDGEFVEVDVAGSLDQARRAGLWHPNCRHSVSGYIAGVTTIPKATAEPEQYRARMRQREIERKIRRWKEQEAAASTDEAKKAARRKVLDWQKQMRGHLAANPKLKRLRYREAPGAGSTPRGGRGPGPATLLGPDVQPDLDGGGTAALPGTRRRSDRDQNLLGSTPGRGQMSLDDLDPGDTTRPAAPPAPPPPPPPEPGEATLGRLLDPADGLTHRGLLDLLLNRSGTADELADGGAAYMRFITLADEGTQGPHAASYRKFLRQLAKHPEPEKLLRRRLGQVKDPAARAATLRAFWHEMDHRARARPRGMQHGSRFRSNTAGVDWAQAEMPLPPLTAEEEHGIRSYTGSSYSLINDGLRGYGGPPSDPDLFDKLVRNCDAAFARASAPEPLIVHRGVGPHIAGSLGADLADPASMHALVGSVHTEKGYLSTSTGRRAAFSGAVYFMFRVPQGYQAMNAMPISNYGTKEREILIRRNARYVIHAVYQRKVGYADAWFIEAEIVADDWTPPTDWTPDPYGDADEGYP